MTEKKSGSIFCKKEICLSFQIAFFILFASILTSCDSSKRINTNYLYFKDGADTVTAQQKETIIQANDVLSIQVFSRTLNQEQTSIFNVPVSSTAQVQGYQVNASGNIEMPVIGSVKASGLTKDQLQNSLVIKLTDYVKNPSVIVKFLQFTINVLGEVKSPGSQKFQVDKVSIIDAISAAGDLTDYGRREDVKVIRNENGKRITYIVDLRSRSLFESTAYFLQPNDIVYVSPNKNKLRNLSVNPDAQRRTSLAFSIISVMLSIATLVIFTTRK